MSKTISTQIAVLMLILCFAVAFTLKQPVVFLALSVALLIILLTVLFPQKLNYFFVFMYALVPRYAGIQFPGIPDITASRILILYYLGFSILLNIDTIIANIKKQRMHIINIAMLVFLVVSLIVLLNVRNGASVKKFIAIVFENIMVFYLVMLNIKDDREARKCMDAMLAAAAVISLFAVFEFFTRINVFTYFGGIGALSETGGVDKLTAGKLARLGFTRVYVTFSHPIALGEYVLLMFYPAFGFMLREKKITKKLIYGGICGLLFVSLLLTLSRAPLLCFFCGLVVYFLIVEKEHKKTMLKLAGAGVFIMLILILSGHAPSFITDIIYSLFVSLTGQYVGGFGGNMSPFYMRLGLVPLTMEIIRGHELLGRGLAFFSVNKWFVFDYTLNPFHKYEVDTFDNFYLLRIVESGFVGIAAYLFVFGSFLITLLQTIKRRAEHSATAVALAEAGFVSIGVYLVCLFSADELSTIQIFWIVSAIFVSPILLQKSSSNPLALDCELEG